MSNKYSSHVTFALAGLNQLCVRGLFRSRVDWRVSTELCGNRYTLIIGCPVGLIDVLKANLFCLSRLEHANLKSVIVVFDCEHDPNLREGLSKSFPDLPLEIGFMDFQDISSLHRAGLFAKPAWLKCWLKWVRGIERSKTSCVVLHDLDALILRPDFFESRFATYQSHASNFLGVTFYRGNGITEEDRVSTTFELFLNAEKVRSEFHAVDAFNRVSKLGKRLVDFDTFLWIQNQLRGIETIPATHQEMVHPSQMICQYVEFVERGRLLSRTQHNLLILPIYASIGGNDHWIEQLCVDIEHPDFDGAIPFLGRQLPIATLTQEHVQWIRKQTELLESTLFGNLRPLTSRLLNLLDRVVPN